MAHDSPYLGDLSQGPSAYVEGTVSVRIFFQSASGTLEQSVMPAAPHVDGPTAPTPLRGVGFAHFNHHYSSPACLIFNVLSELPKRPRVKLSVELLSFLVVADAIEFSYRNYRVSLFSFVYYTLGNLMQLIVRDAAFLCPNSPYHLPQFLPSKLSPQVEEVPFHSPQLSSVEAGPARPCVHRTHHMSDLHI